jgi:hypothetical protein
MKTLNIVDIYLIRWTTTHNYFCGLYLIFFRLHDLLILLLDSKDNFV